MGPPSKKALLATMEEETEDNDKNGDEHDERLDGGRVQGRLSVLCRPDDTGGKLVNWMK